MRVPVRGLRTATKRLADGSRRIYAYLAGELIATGSGRDLEAAKADLARAMAEPDALARLAELAGKRRPVSTAYVAGAVAAFLASREYGSLSASHAREVRKYLDAFRDVFGEERLSLFERRGAKSALVQWRDTLWPDSPRAADYAISAVARFFSWCRAREFTTAKPTEDLGRVHKSNRAEVIWSPGDLARFKSAAPAPVWRVVAFAAETGLRQGDLLSLTWAAIQGRALSVVTSKRRRRVTIPLSEAALSILAEIPREAPHVFLASHGRPWGSGFGASFQRTRAASGLDHLRFHDLRGTAATRFAAMGLSDGDLGRIRRAGAIAGSLDRNLPGNPRLQVGQPSGGGSA